MGNEQTMPQQGMQSGFQETVNLSQINASVTLNQGVPIQETVLPDHKLLIVIRGTRKTGKTTLVTRMRGFPFDFAYQATPAIEITEIPWRSPTNENVLVTAWDTVEHMCVTYDSVGGDDNSKRMDATTVDTLKKADGVVVMINYRSEESIELAEEIIKTAPDDLPVAVFSNFIDLEDSSPVIPERLMQYMGRFFYIPGSLRSNQGLIQLSVWLTVPLIAAKMKEASAMHQAAESEFRTQNTEFCSTASNFFDYSSALKHMPQGKTSEQQLLSSGGRGTTATTATKKYQKPYQRTKLRKSSSSQQQTPSPQQTPPQQSPHNNQQNRPSNSNSNSTTNMKKSEEGFWDDDNDDNDNRTASQTSAVSSRLQNKSSNSTNYNTLDDDNDDDDVPARPNPLVKRKVVTSARNPAVIIRRHTMNDFNNNKNNNSNNNQLTSTATRAATNTAAAASPAPTSAATRPSDDDENGQQQGHRKKIIRKKIVHQQPVQSAPHEVPQPVVQSAQPPAQQYVLKKRKKKLVSRSEQVSSPPPETANDAAHDGYEFF